MTTFALAPTASAAADHYLAERVLTASPVELTAMLFDACVGSIKLAIRLQEAGEHVAALPKLTKAQDIVLELRSTLNHEAGQLSSHLDALYTFAWSELFRAGVRRDTAAARAALEVVEPLQLAWREAFGTSA
jgi:flagellar protein FliS